MSVTAEEGGSRSTSELRRLLTLRHLFVFGLVAMGPVAAFTMYGFVSITSGGATLASYLIGAAGILLTALCFAELARVAPRSGSVYGFATLALGSRPGFLGGWAMLLDYLLLGSLTAVYGALYMESGLAGIPAMAWLTALFVLLLLSAIRGVVLSTRFDIAVMPAQLAFCLFFIAFGLHWILGDGAGAAPALMPASTTLSQVVSGASLTIISFLGFDAVSTLIEETGTAHPGRAVGLATVLSVLAMLVIYLTVSWLLSWLATGLVLNDPATHAFEIIAARLPSLATPLALVCGLAVGVGGTQACLTGATRVVFAMGRDGHLPGVLARVNPRFQSPLVAGLLVLTIIVVISTIALDRTDLLANLVSFGALTGFLIVNLSVVVHFGIRHRSKALIRHWLVPILGAAVVIYILSGISALALEIGLGWMVLGLGLSLI